MEENLKKYLNMHIKEFEKKFYKDNEYTTYRIMRIDDVNLFGTQDLRTDRLNLHLQNDLIINIYTG